MSTDTVSSNGYYIFVKGMKLLKKLQFVCNYILCFKLCCNLIYLTVGISDEHYFIAVLFVYF